MRNGIFIPAPVVRIAVGTVAAAVLAVVVAEAPEIWRYLKIRRM